MVSKYKYVMRVKVRVLYAPPQSGYRNGQVLAVFGDGAPRDGQSFSIEGGGEGIVAEGTPFVLAVDERLQLGDDGVRRHLRVLVGTLVEEHLQGVHATGNRHVFA